MASSALGACTMYASPSGSSANTGKSPSSPFSLLAAVNRARAGSVVCLLAGTYPVDTPFGIYHSGTSSNWIVYTNYNGGVALIVPKSGRMGLMRLGSGIRYVEIKGLQFDGHNTANAAITCSGCDHVRFIGNKISHMGSSGINSYPDPSTRKAPDYITVDHNQIYHCGYNQGFGSAIGFRKNGWYDGYLGFHSFVTNNIISGTYDNSYHRTDGNGIISDNDAGDDTPPALIANNVVYQNGRRCIFSRYARNVWVVNNTCYKNDLYKNAGEFQTYYASNIYEINNLSYAWNTDDSYLDGAPLVDTHYHYNQWIASGTGTIHVLPLSIATNPSALKHANPYFVKPPYVSATASGQYNNAVPPAQITNQFHLQSGSPAIRAGIDPTTLPGVSSEIISGLKQYVYTDIEGHARIPGSRFDLGAYVYSTGPTLANLSPTADSYVNSASPGTSFGSSTQLKVGGSGLMQAAYLKFDLLSLAGKTVTSAKLRFWVNNGASGTYSVKPVSDTSWTESGTTYANRPTAGSAVASVTDPVTNTWIEFDVTALVKASLGKQISFAATSTSTHVLGLDSRQVTYNKPQLIIQ